MSDGPHAGRPHPEAPSVEGVRTLAHLCQQAGVEVLEATDGRWSIRLRIDLSLSIAASAAQVEADAGQAAGAGGPYRLLSQWVGVFHRDAVTEDGGEHYARPGQRVEEGDVLGMVEAMQLQHEVKAEHAGTLARFLVEDGTPVEYGQPLAEIE